MRDRIIGRFMLRRMTAAGAAFIAVILGITLITSAPAYAAGTGESLVNIGGHTCRVIGSSLTYNAILCVDLGEYLSSAGDLYVTLQAEGYCQAISGGSYSPCPLIYADGTVADGAGYTNWLTKNCGPTSTDCQNGRTYFWPFGGIPISGGQCDDNVWGVLDKSGTSIADPSGKVWPLTSQLETAHYNVCMSSGIDGTFTYTPV